MNLFIKALIKMLLYPLVWPFIYMPGRRHRGALRSLNAEQLQSQQNLQGVVDKLAGEIGERNAGNYSGLLAAEQFIAERFRRRGYKVRTESFEFQGVEMCNVEAEQRGTDRSDEIVVIGGHYDTVYGSPGADDNATGVAVMIEIMDKLAGLAHGRTIRFVAFANEENQGGGSWELMGSYAYARGCKQRGEKIVAMLSLEMLGFYRDQPGSQKYPFPFNLLYPNVGNFIAFVGKVGSARFIRNCIRIFRAANVLPSEGVAAPSLFRDINRSDHWSFWQFGYENAFMVTDTSNFRNFLYHTGKDTPEIIDFHRLTLATIGLTAVVKKLLNAA
jgi:hypothetical protein